MKKYTLLLLFLLCFISACGLKGMPEPDMTKDVFSWTNLSASPANDCIAISGSISGNIDNVLRILLEVQSLDESCENCPFVGEMQETYANDIIAMNSNVFQINYCPTVKSDAYRLRLTAENSITGLPEVISNTINVDMKNVQTSEIIITNIELIQE